MRLLIRLLLVLLPLLPMLVSSCTPVYADEVCTAFVNSELSKVSATSAEIEILPFVQDQGQDVIENQPGADVSQVSMKVIHLDTHCRIQQIRLYLRADTTLYIFPTLCQNELRHNDSGQPYYQGERYLPLIDATCRAYANAF